MNKKIGIIGTLLAVMALMALIAVVPAGAADPTNATASTVSNASYSDASVAQSAVAEGGNITEVTVGVSLQTNKWQGYYGTITSGFSLKNSGGTSMYDWSGTTVAGEVYATQDSDVTAAEWAALEGKTGANVDTAFIFTGTDADSAANTFNLEPAANVTVGNNNVTAVNDSEVKTKNNAGTAIWETIALGPSSVAAGEYSKMVFAGVIIDGGNAYDNSAKDFQMIVPVQSSPAPYYFYVELDV